MFRTAALPFDDFLKWSSGLEAPSYLDQPKFLERALRSDRQKVRQRLRAMVTRPEIREALFLASVELHGALDRWLEDPDSKKGLRAERTLVRYFSRMSGRSTPFGLFAGYSLGFRGEKTRLALESQHLYKRHTRLDMDYLSALVESLAKNPTLQETMVYRPNSSIYRTSGRLHYAESRRHNNRRSYHLVAVDETDYLLDTLMRAEKGESLSALTLELVDDEITFEDASSYIGELVDTQLLVPDLHPKATGSEPVQDLIAQLRSHPSATSVVDGLQEAQDGLTAIDASPPGIDVSRYEAISSRLKELPAKMELSRLFQVDMRKPAVGATLGDEVVEELTRSLNLLHGLRAETAEEELSRFREAFSSRYENREMPLVDVLDDESGVGFGDSRGGRAETSPLLDGLAFPRGHGVDKVAWGAFDAFLLNKLVETSRTGEQVLTLSPDDLEPYKAVHKAVLPNSCAVIARLAAVSQEALVAGDFRLFVSGAAGPSGAVLLGRFCHGDPDLLAQVSGYIEAEEALQPQVIFAEIVHLPEGHVGNVILRPVLRRYEIPFLGRSAVADDRQIPITDLLVSVRANRVVLRSARLRKEIVPRLTSAHNFNQGPAMYRFLCALQTQGVARALGWQWGPLEAARFLPRVVVGKIVLARARWRVDRKEIMAAVEAREPDRYALLHKWRRERNLPRFALLSDGDNTLPLDFDNILSAETFLELVKRRAEFRIEEFYPGPEELCAIGPEGRFVHELVVPLILKGEPSVQEIDQQSDARAHLRRSFAPGSEWLFAKLYTGSAGADRLLQQVIAPLVGNALRDGLADGWFFVRYGDPDWHLRVRFHGDPGRLAGELLPRLHAACAPLLENGLLWKIQLDTYERELERYGVGTAMLISELIFQIDSETTLEVLGDLVRDTSADARWRLTLRGTDQLLDDLGFDRAGKHAVITMARSSFLKEMNAGAGFERQLGDRYRRERRSLEVLLDRANDESSPHAAGLATLHRRSQRFGPVFIELRERAAAGDLSVPLESLAASYVHMSANRLLRSAARSQEVVIYDFLTRLYESQRARARNVI